MLQAMFNRFKRPVEAFIPTDKVIYKHATLEGTESVYENQIDPTFAAALTSRHFNPYLDNMKCSVIMQEFFKDYFNNPALILTEIVEYKDWSTGMPSYVYKYRKGE